MAHQMHLILSGTPEAFPLSTLARGASKWKFGSVVDLPLTTLPRRRVAGAFEARFFLRPVPASILAPRF